MSLMLTTLQTETLFHTYSQFSTAANIPPKPTEEERSTETKLQEILDKVGPTFSMSIVQTLT